VFIGGRKINEGSDERWGCNLAEQADISNGPLRNRFTLQLLQHSQGYVQMPCRDVMRVSSSAANQQEIFAIHLAEP